MSLSVPSRGPSLLNACLLEVEGKATGIPKATGIARARPAVLPAARRTAKGKGRLTRWSSAQVLCSLFSPETNQKISNTHTGWELLWARGPVPRSLGALIQQPLGGWAAVVAAHTGVVPVENGNLDAQCSCADRSSSRDFV